MVWLRCAVAGRDGANKGLAWRTLPRRGGGTAVGTGLNAPAGFDKAIAEEIAALTGFPFITAPNKFAAQASSDAIAAAHAALRGLAVALLKIANDMRWLASGRVADSMS